MTARQRNSSKGGKKAAKKHGKAFVEARASKGGKALLTRYSKEYFRALAKMRYAKKPKK